MIPTGRIAWEIPVPRPCFDHRFENRAVLPAVVALRHLAAVADRHSGAPAANTVTDARFERLLPLPDPGAGPIQAWVELAPAGETRIAARLMTRREAGPAGIARWLTHVQAVLGTATAIRNTPAPPATDIGFFQFPAARLYADLVPFGPAFRNVVGHVKLGPDGARAVVRAPQWPGDHQPAAFLGSPYPLDAALHVACAWGQRYAACVPFPVGFDRLVVAEPTVAGREYRCNVSPRGHHGTRLTFDIDLRTSAGGLAESVVGLRMQDIRRRPSRPPRWILAPDQP